MKLQWLVRMDLKCVCERERGRDRENTEGYFLEVSVKINTWRAPKKKKKKDTWWRLTKLWGVTCVYVSEWMWWKSRVTSEREREWKYLDIQFITNSYRFHTSQFPVVRKWVLWRSLVFFYFSCWWQRRHVRLTKSNVHKNKNKNEVQYWCTMSLPPFYLTICLILRALRWTEFFNLFLLLIYFTIYEFYYIF